MAWLCGCSAALAQPTSLPLFRCEGPPALYIVDARLALQRGCKAVSQAQVRTSARAATQPRVEEAAPPTVVSAPSRFVSKAIQRERDVDRGRILREELHSERERLAVLQQRLGTSGTLPADAELPSAVQRVESNIAALQRELAATNLR
jgi:hypothetical protein